MTIKEIAKIAGVSVSTVSKIVNRKDENISPETRERVLNIVKEYNYTPYASSIPSTQKTWCIGVLARSAHSLDGYLDGIIESAQQNGYTVTICNSYSDSEQELKNITALCSNHIDGILWEPVDTHSYTFSVNLEKQQIPFLYLGKTDQNPSLCFPYDQFGYQLTEELINRNHTKIACLSSSTPESGLFLAGYQNCLFDHHLLFDETLVFTDVNDTLIYKLNTHQITGIISSCYEKSLDFYQSVRALHYHVPDDFSLISLKDDSHATPSLPQISAVALRKKDYGNDMCGRLVALMESRATDMPPYLPDFAPDNFCTVSEPYEFHMPKILIVGSINMDTYLHVSELPDTSRTMPAFLSSIYPGGKGLNQSVGVKKLGHSVSLIGNVGSDPDADKIYQTLNEYNIDTSGVKRCQNADTGKAYIFVNQEGSSTISLLAGANATLSPQDIRDHESCFEQAGYCLLQSEIPLETIEEVCKIAKRHHVKTIFKPTSCPQLPFRILQFIDILIPNEDELLDLCPSIPTLTERVDFLYQSGIQTVIVTLGERGCYVKTSEFAEYFPAVEFTPVDRTGASDAFSSALCSYLLYGYPFKKAIRIASYAAAFCISREGVIPSLIDKATLESYIQQKEPDLLSKY